MTTIANDTLLRTLRREPTPFVPVWLMRPAGRYLPEYSALRAKAGSFLALATNPALAAEVTLQPLERFPLDAAILFSDILTVPDAMGLGLSFAEGEGPRFAPGTTWICYSDQVMHAASSGQFMLEQTTHLPLSALYEPERSPLAVLEHITARALVPSSASRSSAPSPREWGDGWGEGS